MLASDCQYVIVGLNIPVCWTIQRVGRTYNPTRALTGYLQPATPSDRTDCGTVQTLKREWKVNDAKIFYSIDINENEEPSQDIDWALVLRLQASLHGAWEIHTGMEKTEKFKGRRGCFVVTRANDTVAMTRVGGNK